MGQSCQKGKKQQTPPRNGSTFPILKLPEPLLSKIVGLVCTTPLSPQDLAVGLAYLPCSCTSLNPVATKLFNDTLTV